MKLRGAAAVVECLRLEGVRFIFGIPGGQTLSIMDCLYDMRDIRFITMRHESAAASAADGYGRVTGRAGVCLATTGPGATNLITGVAGAFRDSSPMLVVTCNNRTKDIGRDDVQDADHVSLFRTVTKRSTLVTDARQIPDIMREALRVAVAGRPGPVHVDFARDVLEDEEVEFDPMPPSMYRVEARPVDDAEKLERAVELLVSSRRPAIWAGNGVKISGAREEVLALARKLHAPVVTTFNGIGSVPTTDKHVFGPRTRMGSRLATKILTEADVVLVVGNSLNAVSTSRWTLPLTRQLIQIDIDQTMIGKHYPVAIGIVGDARSNLQMMLSILHTKTETADSEARLDWLFNLQREKEKWFSAVFKPGMQDHRPVKPQILMKILGEVMSKEAVVAVDAGNAGVWSHLLPIYEGTTYMKPANFGNMGFALPAGIAAKLIYPEREVVVLVGDGSLGMCVAELETAVRENVPLIVVVLNDQAFGNIKQEQFYKFGPRYIGVDFCESRFAEIARGFGAAGERVENVEAFVRAFERARRADVPYVIDVLIDPSENVWMDPF